MSSSNKLRIAPAGKIAIVCCSPDNTYTTKYDNTLYRPESYVLATKPETELNKFDENAFLTAAACGFNVFMYPGSDLKDHWIDYTQQALDLCKNLRIKLIINSPILSFLKSNNVPEYKRNWPESYVEKFVNHPALGGWQIKDEPIYSEWHDIHDPAGSNLNNIRNLPTSTIGGNIGGISQICDCINLLKNYNVISQMDPNHIVFMNLAADNREDLIGSNTTYKDFLDEYVAKINPPLLTFDYYPIRSYLDSDGKEVYTVDTNNFYNYLNLFSDKSKSSGKPFWSYCLCLSHKTRGANYPEATEGMLRFEAFTALAFGAQGLVFWRYKQEYTTYHFAGQNNPLSQPCVAVNDEIAPVDLYGEYTDVWDNVQQVISEIASKNDYFYNCKMTSYGDYDGNYSNLNMYGDASLDKIRISGRGFLMTRIETPDQEETYSNGKPVIHKYIVIVSMDPFNSQELQWLYVQDPNSTVDKNICTPVFNDNGNGNYENDPWRKETLPPGGCKIFEI